MTRTPLLCLLNAYNLVMSHFLSLLLAFPYVVVQSLGRVRLFATPWTAARQAPLSFTISQSLLTSCPLSQWCYLITSSSAARFSFCLLSFPASGSFPSICTRWPKYWSFSFSIGPSSEYSGLISFRIDWFDLLALPYTLF